MTDREDKWDFYLCRVEDKPASIYLNLGFKNFEGQKYYPLSVRLKVYLQHPGEHGLTTNAEAEVLGEMEDALDDVLRDNPQVLYVGRCTTDGSRDFIFYGNKELASESALREVMQGFPEYRFEIDVSEDGRWELYHQFLYPTPRDAQWMYNRNVVDALEQEGDPLTRVREINHVVLFNSNADREQFEEQVAGLEFRITDRMDPDDESSRYGLELSHDDIPRLDRINGTTLKLMDMAEKFNGKYDGWGTTVEK